MLSAGLRPSYELMLKVQQHCQGLGSACNLVGRQDSPELTRLEARLSRGARIIALPANPMTARGYSADVFLDEFAMHHDDRAIWAALLPSLMRSDGELDVASTPRGRNNIFFELQRNPTFVHT